ncbi:hypothetical protein ACO0LG_27420 [Undibacterium sp. Ji42W]|uniref:hypothetical protein n=1 Tax=Undibacterium sp. Ji42W TaxID=3413039 RepID=UPI003BF27E39
MSELPQTGTDDVVNPVNEQLPGIQSKATGLPETAPVVLMFIVAHLVLTGLNFPYYFELFRTGQLATTTAMLTMFGWILLYLGGIQNARKSKSSGTLWMLATVFFAMSLPGWRMMQTPGSVVLFGCLLALAGWWAVRQTKKTV